MWTRSEIVKQNTASPRGTCARHLTTSIMITTRNRCEELKRTCTMLARLDPIPAEILITADGCNDGTVAVVRRMLPNAKVFENPSAQGSVAARDRMMREATSDLVLALDDDSYPEEQDCITRIGRMFEHNSL